MSGQIALRPSYWASVSGGKDYRIVVLKSVEVKRVIDYYESKNFI